ncbi:MAG: thioredoxin-disulfide reductase [Bacilli bacterium]|jgi:thioredoxin reductase (NADPH)|nr:thioredoxin-disulfide reductase [Bacilli bacterium]
MNNKIYDLIIIGAGPAGMSAAIYAKRASLEVMIIEAVSPGGKMIKTAEIENWPGLKQTTGPELAFSMFDHINSLAVEYQAGHVSRIEDGEIKKIITDDHQTYLTKSIIIATGTVERKLGIPGEEKFAGKGVSYCAVCDGALFKNKVVTVIGGGNSALEEAIYLAKFASQVNIVIRRDVFRADALVQEDIQNNSKINIILKHIPIEIQGDTVLKNIILENVDTKERQSLMSDGLFPFIGLDPITNFVQDLGITNQQGYINVDANMRTAIPGLYAAGDVIDKGLRQIVTASSDGAIAAQQVIKYLDDNK